MKIKSSYIVNTGRKKFYFKEFAKANKFYEKESRFNKNCQLICRQEKINLDYKQLSLFEGV